MNLTYLAQPFRYPALMINIQKMVNSFGYAFKGIGHLIKLENNARVHLLATICIAGLGFWHNLLAKEWALLTIVIGIVWITEILNTALERLTDLVSPNYHKLAGQAKDLGAAAVLLASLVAVIVGLLIFIPKWLI